ncbi:hypothetical protein [Fimbriimonas ginsengisoli]|uniref:Lipoprotein n=1 Tax=Fimbriimonas ginsengisoli Gsoil 348 TaxID=661478 RepID=A0A068NX31_FIMGI|nr:hypothetical protein [Fimbriimonas ginsengisoli]AIE87996.1 hypothetical protein OP10G_4628 [Fimbriimonas ginsengisoli Gsoil 348]
MRRLGILLVAGLMVVGCSASGPSDADQQKLAKDFSPENVAKEYEKQGKMKEAAEVRASMKQGQQGQ